MPYRATQHNAKTTNRMVFVFIVLGLTLLAIFTSVILIKNKTFVDKVYYRTVLNNAKGLSARPTIFFKGIEIGRVESFSLDPYNNDINVNFYIFEQYRDKIVRYAILAGNQNMLLGDVSAFELILPLRERVGEFEPLPAGDLVAHIGSKLAQAHVKSGFISIQGNSIDSIIASVNTLLINLQQENNPDAGSLFRILDRVAKITDHLLKVSKRLDKSDLLEQAEGIVFSAKDILANVPGSVNQFNKVVGEASNIIGEASVVIGEASDIIGEADILVKNYQQPGAVIDRVTGGKVPLVLDNLNTSLDVLQTMLKDVNAQRDQLAVTVHSIQQVLNRLDKTLQGVNNNPLIKPGIEKLPPRKGVEMNDQ
ncbi:MAG: ABC-type transporter Mla subunit MlaD [Phenylobacterium sp.]|jgi:ABC-type transporter Mla subunit MlaD